MSAEIDSPKSTTTRQRRRRRSSVTERILAGVQGVEAKVEHALLVLWDELPSWRRDNAFIVGGYRQTSNSYVSLAHSRSAFS